MRRSSELAPSAISSSDRMQRSISSSRCFSTVMAETRPWIVCIGCSSSVCRNASVRLADCRLYATSSSCFGVRLPSFAARCTTPLMS